MASHGVRQATSVHPFCDGGQRWVHLVVIYNGTVQGSSLLQAVFAVGFMLSHDQSTWPVEANAIGSGITPYGLSGSTRGASRSESKYVL